MSIFAFKLSVSELHLMKKAEQGFPGPLCLPLQLKHNTTLFLIELFLFSLEG